MIDVRVSRSNCSPSPDVVLDRVAQVLDPELDESLVDLGFIRSLDVHDGHATVQLQLPTNWCAANFAFIMSEDIRFALLSIDGIDRVTIRLGDHFAAPAIEAAVNAGHSFEEAFAREGGGGVQDIRDTFLRKGYIRRQERLLRRLRDLGLCNSAICALRVKDVIRRSGSCIVESSGDGELDLGPAEIVSSYLQRRQELGLPCAPTDPLIVVVTGQPLSAEQLESYFAKARAVRLSMEANGSLCRALLAARNRSNEILAPKIP